MDKEEAWKFLTWFNSNKGADGATGMGSFLASNGLIPPRKADAALLEPKLLAADPNLKAIYDAAEYAMAESNAANAYKAKTSLHTHLSTLLINKATVDQTFTSLTTEIDKK